MFKSYPPLGLHYPPRAEPAACPSLLDLVRVLAFFAILLHNSFAVSAGPDSIQITSARVWPAQDYTRLTIEAKKSIRHMSFDPRMSGLNLDMVAEQKKALLENKKIKGDIDVEKLMNLGYLKKTLEQHPELVADLPAVR